MKIRCGFFTTKKQFVKAALEKNLFLSIDHALMEANRQFVENSKIHSVKPVYPR